VTNYSIISGVLSLQHNYPPQDSKVTALVDVKIIMEPLKATDLRFGEWLNIIGYVPFPSSGEKTRKERQIEPNPQIAVQAIMLWSAGAIQLGEYEQALAGRLRNGTNSKRSGK